MVYAFIKVKRRVIASGSETYLLLTPHWLLGLPRHVGGLIGETKQDFASCSISIGGLAG